MDWLTELCRVLAYIVLERYDKSVSFARTLDITPPSGELVKAIVIVKFSLPARVDKKQSVSVSRLPIVEHAYSVSGDPGTTVTVNGPACSAGIGGMSNATGAEPNNLTWTGVGADGTATKQIDLSIRPMTYAERMAAIAAQEPREAATP